jgi:hypothetical protein
MEQYCYDLDLPPGSQVMMYPQRKVCTVRQTFRLFHVIDCQGSLSYLPREAEFLILP